MRVTPIARKRAALELLVVGDEHIMRIVRFMRGSIIGATLCVTPTMVVSHFVS